MVWSNTVSQPRTPHCGLKLLAYDKWYIEQKKPQCFSKMKNVSFDQFQIPKRKNIFLFLYDFVSPLFWWKYSFRRIMLALLWNWNTVCLMYKWSLSSNYRRRVFYVDSGYCHRPLWLVCLCTNSDLIKYTLHLWGHTTNLHKQRAHIRMGLCRNPFGLSFFQTKCK